jgi:hypothetical protein
MAEAFFSRYEGFDTITSFDSIAAATDCANIGAYNKDLDYSGANTINNQKPAICKYKDLVAKNISNENSETTIKGRSTDMYDKYSKVDLKSINLSLGIALMIGFIYMKTSEV